MEEGLQALGLRGPGTGPQCGLAQRDVQRVRCHAGQEAGAPLGGLHHLAAQEVAYAGQEFVEARHIDRAFLLGRCRQRDGAGNQQVHAIHLALRGTPPDARTLDGRVRAVAVAVCHGEAADGPPEGTEHFPELDVRGVHGAAAGVLVALEQVLVAAEAAHWPVATKAPGVGAEPAQVAHGVADVRQFPIQHRDDAVAVDHQVAVAEVAMHQARRNRRRRVFQEPAGRVVDHGLWRLEGLVALPGFAHELRWRGAGQPLAQPRGRHIDAVDAGQGRAAVIGQAAAGVRQGRVADDAGAQGLAIEPLHDEAGTQPVRVLEHMVYLRRRHAGVSRRNHQLGFGGQAEGAVRLRPTGGPPQREAAPAIHHHGIDAIRLLACAAREPLDAGDAHAAGDGTGEDGFQERLEVRVGRGHGLPKGWATVS